MSLVQQFIGNQWSHQWKQRWSDHFDLISRWYYTNNIVLDFLLTSFWILANTKCPFTTLEKTGSMSSGSRRMAASSSTDLQQQVLRLSATNTQEKALPGEAPRWATPELFICTGRKWWMIAMGDSQLLWWRKAPANLTCCLRRFIPF